MEKFKEPWFMALISPSFRLGILTLRVPTRKTLWIDLELL